MLVPHFQMLARYNTLTNRRLYVEKAKQKPTKSGERA
jgi:hypothetical protein